MIDVDKELRAITATDPADREIEIDKIVVRILAERKASLQRIAKRIVAARPTKNEATGIVMNEKTAMCCGLPTEKCTCRISKPNLKGKT